MSILNSREIKKVNRFLKKVLKDYNIKSNIEEFFSSKENSEIIYDMLTNIMTLLEDTSNQFYLDILLHLDEKGVLEATYIVAIYYNETCLDLDTAIKWFKKAAEQGFARAQCTLGILYNNGQGVNQSYKKAVKWYTLAAEQGLASAQNNLGVLYNNGQGVNQSYKEAVKWYTLAAEQDYAVAQNNLGALYNNGQGVNQSYKKAAELFALAANHGNTDAQYNLGNLYYKGLGVNKDYAEAYKWYKLAAEQRHAIAQFRLGSLYYKGLGVNKNREEAYKWYKLAAEQGNEWGQYCLGAFYQDLKQYEYALRYYMKAAKQGNEHAQFSLGNLYFQGLGVNKDYAEAYKWYKLAADRGHEGAQNLVKNIDFDNCFDTKKWLLKECEKGSSNAMYLLGTIMLAEKDNIDEGIKWLKKASDDNDYYSCFQLGLMYYKGEYFLQSYDKAKYYFEKAVYTYERNTPNILISGDAYYYLGYIYFKGLTNDKNYELSKEYFEKAVRLGYNCRYALEAVQRELGSITEDNVIRDIYNKSNDIDEFIENVRNLIGDYSFDNFSKTFIFTALENYYFQIDRKINNSKERDFSSSTTPLLKAFEHIIKEEIVNKYGKYLEEKSFYDTLKSKKIDKFTLGNFKQFLSIKEEQTSSFLGEGNISFTSKIQITDKELLEFLKTEIFDLSKFSSDNAEYELINYLWNLVQEVKQINDFRIDSVHNEIISIDYAETTFNYLLFNQKVISNFLNKLKRK